MVALDSAKSQAPEAVPPVRPRWYSVPEKRAVVAACAAAVPVVAVNATAFIGQFAFLNDHVPWPVAGRVLIALTIESIAVYIAWHAHLAQMKNDSAMRLKLGAYLVALTVGVMNYSHFAEHWRPTFMAVLMFLMSTLSPWLWGIHSRRASRDELMKRGLVEEHAVRLGATRVTWHPVRSVRVMSWSAWHGENDPKRVIDHFAPRYGTADVPAAPRQEKPGTPGPRRPGAPGERVHVGTEPWIAPDVPRVPDPLSGSAPVLDGTVLNGEPVPQPAVHQGEAHLEAHGSVSGGGRPSPEKVAEVEEWLEKIPDAEVTDAYPSVREIARQLGDRNQRRLAARLKSARMAQSAQHRALHNGSGNVRTLQRGNLIASPAGFRPGGVHG